MRTHRAHLLSAALAVALIAACTPVGSSPEPPSTPSSRSATQPADPSPSPLTLVPIWPFTTPSAVRAWQDDYRSAGRAAWHLDVERTALSFSRTHLGYSEIDRVTTRSVTRGDARIGVGWADDNGSAHTVGVLHLVRFGTAQDAPWVVVGSEDTYLTLTQPRYGSTIGSPMTVGGRITGVDESLQVKVVGPESGTALAEVRGIPAGGENTPWSVTVRLAPPPGAVLTVAVSTGGHLKTVERFAITAVRTA